jgi:hypothetical protein
MANMSTGSPFQHWRRSWALIATATVSSAATADLFFFRHQLGWTAGGYLLLLAILLATRSWRPTQRPWISLLLLAVIGLGVALVQSPTRFNIPCAALAIGTLAISLRVSRSAGTRQWLARWRALLLAPLSRPIHDSRYIARWMMRHPGTVTGPLRTLGLWMIPVCLGGFFALLFAVANPIVDHWSTVAFNWATQWIAQLLETERTAVWIAAAAVTYGMLRVARKRKARHWPAIGEVPIVPPFPVWIPETAIVLRCLLLFNVIFGVETVLDAIYLWGGRTLPAGVTHVQYAHRGAYPLIATALLAGLFVLLTFRENCQTKNSRPARWLVYAWILQNIQLTLSAAWRLWLLVDSSLLTRLRLATSIWLLLVAAGLATLIWRIVTRRNNSWLIGTNCAMGAVVLYICCFVNYDGFIASWNADHCEFLRQDVDGGNLAYFQTLGEESLPALRGLVPKLNNPESRSAAEQMIGELSRQLADETSEWQGWTARRAMLHGQFPTPAGYIAHRPSDLAPREDSTWAQRNSTNSWSRYGE